MKEPVLRSFDDFYALLEKGWNCAEAYTPEYEAEHEEIHVLMKSRLHDLLGGQKYGNHSFEAFGAFEDCWTVSRCVGAYLKSDSFLKPDFVRCLEKIVEEFPHDYLMHIKAEDFEPEMSDFELAITKEFIWVLLYEDESDLSKIHDT